MKGSVHKILRKNTHWLHPVKLIYSIKSTIGYILYIPCSIIMTKHFVMIMKVFLGFYDMAVHKKGGLR